VDHVKEIVEMSWEQTFLYFAMSESSYQVGDCVIVTPNCNSYDSITRRACNIVSHKSARKDFSAKLDAVLSSVLRLSGEKKRPCVRYHWRLSTKFQVLARGPVPGPVEISDRVFAESSRVCLFNSLSSAVVLAWATSMTTGVLDII
jgi:hypothetical protein